MIIDAIQLEHLGPFNGSTEVGPAGAGINVLAAANESGKTTVVKAAVRCLFDKHTCKDSEIRQLQPAGTDLAPKVRVDFQVGETRYRIAKRFLDSPTSELFEDRDGDWKLISDGDKADSRLVELLGSGQPGRGASKPAHWGMTQYLWGRQGELAIWPDWEGEAGDLVRARFAKVEIDPIVTELSGALMEEYSTNFTNGGRPKKGGALQRGQESLESLNDELTVVQRKLQELEAKEAQFQTAQEELRRLDAEHAELKAEADKITAIAGKAEAVAKEVENLEKEQEASAGRLSAVKTDEKNLATIQGELTVLEQQHSDHLAKGEDLAGRKKQANEAVDEAEKKAKELRKTADTSGESVGRFADILSLRAKLDSLTRLRDQLKKVRDLTEERGQLQKKFDALPKLTPAKLKSLRKLEQTIREKQIQIDAQGMKLEMRSLKAGMVVVETDGEEDEVDLKADLPESLVAIQEIRLRLNGWGEVHVRSGAEEVKELADELTNAESELAVALKELAVESVDAAEQALADSKELKAEIKRADKSLTEALDEWDDKDAMESEETSLAALTDKLANQLALTEEEKSMATADLEAKQELIKGKVASDQAALETAQEALKDARQTLQEAETAVSDHATETVRIEGEIKNKKDRINDIEQRYADGISAAVAKAEGEFVEAEARFNIKRKELPEDYESLPQRNQRAAKAVGEVAAELDSKKTDFHRLEGELKSEGAAGPYSTETRLLEEIARTEPEVNHARTQGWAARLVHDLMAHRKDEATRSVLRPLEDRLTEQFEAITRKPNRRVFLDEELQIKGIGREDELISFESLSQGAREQLLLSLRLAVALELAEDGPQCLILDDVLVNSDRARQERIMDVLDAAKEKIQIFILTCHPNWYRGLGTTLQMEAQA